MQLKQLILNRHYTISGFSRTTGVPYTTIHDIVSGKSKIEECSYSTLVKIADTLNVSLDRLVSGTAGDKLSREEIDSFVTPTEQPAITVERRVPVFPSQLRSPVSPFLLKAYIEMYGAATWTPNLKLIDILIQLIKEFYSELGIDIDESLSESLGEHPVLTTRAAGAASERALRVLALHVADDAIKPEEGHILTLAVVTALLSLQKEDNSYLSEIELQTTNGIFAFASLIRFTYATANIYSNFIKDDDYAIKYALRDVLGDIATKIPVGIYGCKFIVPGDVVLNGALANSVITFRKSFMKNINKDNEPKVEAFFMLKPFTENGDYYYTILEELTKSLFLYCTKAYKMVEINVFADVGFGGRNEFKRYEIELDDELEYKIREA